jgi:mRNA interferase MazF
MYDPGDIVIVPFPYSDQITIERRPALVVSSSQFNSATPDVVLCGITSRLSDGTHRVSISDADLTQGRLVRPGQVVVSRIAVFLQTGIIKRCGTLNQTKMGEVKVELSRLFELNRAA